VNLRWTARRGRFDGRGHVNRGAIGKAATGAFLMWMVLASFAVPIRAVGPTVPANVNPGALQNQFLKRPPEPPTTAPAEQVLTGAPPATQPTTRPGGPTFQLRQVHFTPSQFMTPEELDDLVRPYLDKVVSFADLQAITTQINARYLAKGVLTGFAVLPPQTIKDGVVEIQLVEGKLGQVQIEGNHATTQGYILDRLPLQSGQVIEGQGIERSLDYFNRTNDTQLKAALRPGAEFGLTDILLYAQEPARFRMDLGVDDYGNPATGRVEGTEFFNIYSPLKLGDRLNIHAAESEGALNGDIAYSVPFTTLGTRIGVSFADSYMHVVHGPSQSLNIKGPAWVAGVDLTQPLIATQHWLLETGLQYSHNRSRTRVSGVDLGPTTVDKLSLGLTVQGTWDKASFSLIQTLGLADSTSPPNVSNQPVTYTGSLYGQYYFLPQLYGSMLVGWQYTPDKILPPVELFQVGGNYSVRGIDSDALTGNSGVFMQNELHVRPAKFFDGYAFLDQGYLWSTFPVHQDVQSAGVGTRWFLWDHLTLNVWVGFPFQRVVPGQKTCDVGLSLLATIPF
jgi:hemolysin activation/secretion protein